MLKSALNNKCSTLFKAIGRRYATQSSIKHVGRSKDWKSVIGLEIHAQIQSKSKLFSGAEVTFGAASNSCVSLFDAAIPGTLPVLNRACVEQGVRTALALGCTVSPVSMFDRKHYFYADLPAGYQITQQRAPLAKAGVLTFPIVIPGCKGKPYYKSSRLFQLQLEQDSGKSLHDPYEKKSLVDLNRAGVPLMELVFQPDLETGEEAAALVKELILILTRLGSCNCRMEEGALRVDANISVHRENTPLGTRTEVKNIGSVRAVAQAVEFEIERQIKVLENGEKIFNETRAWDAVAKKTISMRDKEVVQDYRFMPEPNLPPLYVSVEGAKDTGINDVDATSLLAELPELPDATRKRLVEVHKLATEMAIILVNDITLYRHFHAITEESGKRRSPKSVAKFLVNEVLATLNKNKVDLQDSCIPSEHIAELVDMLDANVINLQLASQILQESLDTGHKESPAQIAQRKDWVMNSDSDRIESLCRKVIDENPKIVSKYRKGKEKMIYALAGEVARAMEQKVDMAKAVAVLKEMLKK
ncbi:glutamyl-tRNA(Gln) amidotransferase subunit B, mitochondrial [Wyeomyia smithii]|uniref:glutamyl-tRNA(Gln) amidotransferase subunit B, mitochondrial n=1 Tax=Wyeomyia smithii TaxID=174621 RepID=UPI002467FAE1|nr:glutamyl-tRNA(Gln) amidotransferase subunit B, mitochondrial [Wyeomyia smithii]